MASIQRRKTVAALIGGVRVGSDAPVVVQSMTNTDTADVASTAQQVAALARAGSELVRVTVNNEEAAAGVAPIVDELEKRRIRVPIIGDFHYNGHILLKKYPECARALDKYRINPGNVSVGRKDDSNFRTMIEVAVENQKPVRIGVNWGSLDQSLLTRMMDENSRLEEPKDAREVTMEAMVVSALNSAASAEKYGLRPDQIILSAQVSACPGCGRTTSTFFQEMAEQIQSYLREQMPVWKGRYSGVEEMRVAVMGCVVNGPGESKHANLGISLPGTFEEPKAPVYVDGRLFTTLRGDRIVAEFIKILDRYVESHYADVGAGVPARAV